MIDRCLVVSRFALDLCKKNTSDLSEIVQYIQDGNDEGVYVSVCNVLFSYCKNQYRIASTDEQRKYVTSSMTKLYDEVFDGRYLSKDTINVIFILACNINSGPVVKQSIEKIATLNDLMDFPVTCNYIYKYCANYIVDTGIFCQEPYTSILEQMMAYISENNPAIKMPPDYLS